MRSRPAPTRRYVDKVRDKIVEAVCAADQAKVEARCGAGVGKEDRVAFNRRLRMKNGVTYTHPGQNNPEVHRVRRPDRSGRGRARGVGRLGQVARLRGQLRLPRHDQPRRDLGQLCLLPGADDSRGHGTGCDRGLPPGLLRATSPRSTTSALTSFPAGSGGPRSWAGESGPKRSRRCC